MDEPKEQPYHGALMSLQRQYDIIDFPLRHHVQTYHSTGRSDLEPTEPLKVKEKVKETEQVKETEKVKEVEKVKETEKVKEVEKVKETEEAEQTRYEILATKKASTRDFPLHVSFEGPIHETHKVREAKKLPLEEHLDTYPLRHPPYVAKKVEEKGGFKFRLVFLGFLKIKFLWEIAKFCVLLD